MFWKFNLVAGFRGSDGVTFATLTRLCRVTGAEGARFCNVTPSKKFPLLQKMHCASSTASTEGVWQQRVRFRKSFRFNKVI